MGETQGTVLNVTRVPTGRVARFKVRSVGLSLANIGGVAVNDDGDTMGIVDGVDDGEASILPTAVVRQAAKRVLARQASVPKLWLGVKGEPVATTRIQAILNLGWEAQKAAKLTENHHGILLTWIAPGSPAALAALRPGDVILKANDEAIQTADDFSWLLDQSGPSGSVRFSVARPERSTPEAVSVKLSESLDPNLSSTIDGRSPRALLDQGIETIALKPAVASRLGATAGLLVIYLQPSTAAFKAGLRPGDVIEAIDGKQVSSFHRPILLSGPAGVRHTFHIVRNKQQLVLTVVNSKPQK
jgi:serine protease Do